MTKIELGDKVMNKEQIEALIEKFGIKYHKVFIGDILERIKTAEIGGEFNEGKPYYYDKLIKLWDSLGFERDLQNIIKESGWEGDFCVRCGIEEKDVESSEAQCFPSREVAYSKHNYITHLKSENARALFEFLNDILK